MFSNIMFVIGLVVLFFCIKNGSEEMKLYKKGVKRRAKLVEIAPYSYMVVTPDKNKTYNVGLNPILEVEDNNKKIRVEYDSYDEMRDLKVGDELEVIYPEGHINKLTRYSFVRLFKNCAILGAWAALIIGLSIIMMIF